MASNDKATVPGPRRSPEQTPTIPGQRIPTAAPAPVHLTAEQLQREIDNARQHEPYLVGYSSLQAHAAFGDGAA